MKKLMLLAAVAVFGLTSVNAQDDDSNALSEGSIVIEANTGSWTTGSTAISLTSIDGETQWSAGGEVGYFIKDNLAIKAGLGYSDLGEDFSVFSYKVGAKYYIGGEFPVGVDYTGSSIKDAEENPSYVGVEGGYAWFPASNVSIEPKLRYNVSMNDEFYESAFQFLVGFAIHF
ncbi:hypothetical protein [Psychroserpens sp. SPM9]|uniref:hypothetical protein n=1 Tax=Psychroserpens sp. SPM9 TaxID=2975598 RepID=UPI0021A5F7FA|nr:hypothetical protein [Psychroserpens sp. SPM9]MDG5491417.1 hypothetical protein [Psychroserpens sp. SPM9]